MNELVIDAKWNEKRFAVMENGQPIRIYVEQPQDRSEVGHIYYGIVESVKTGMNAAFVQLGNGKKNGFLQRDQLPAYIHSTEPNKQQLPISKFIRQGEKILVQVKKDETGVKGPMLSAIIEWAGEKLVYMPEGKYVAVSKKATNQQRETWKRFAQEHLDGREGLIIRTEALSSTESGFLLELTSLKQQHASLLTQIGSLRAPCLVSEKSRFIEELSREKVRLRSGAIYCNEADTLNKLKEGDDSRDWSFHLEQSREDIFLKYDIEPELQKTLHKAIWLKNGAYLVINETEAAVIVDVNTGKFTGKGAKAQTVLETNLLAADEIARQLQLRDYGGMILIDFIDMPSLIDRKKVEAQLEQALRKDPKSTRIAGFTALGIFELTRKRTKQSLPEMLQAECPMCNGSGRVISPETAAFRLERKLRELPAGEHDAVLIECDPETKSAFCGESGKYLGKMETELGLKIFFKQVPHGFIGSEIRRFGTLEEMTGK